MKIWLDGELVDKAHAKVDVYDHGLLYGDGVFEGIRAYNGRIFQCASHVERLYRSARLIRLAIPYTKQEIVEAMTETLKANGLSEAYIRLVVTRGIGTLGLNPFTCGRPTVFVIADLIQLYPKEMYEDGMAVIIAKTLRTSPTMLDPTVKSLNYLNNIMAKAESIDAGAPEAIMLNEHGNVAECTGDNIFLVKGGEVITPPPEAGCLIGITRAVVMHLSRKMGLPCHEKDIGPKDLFAADECFLTGTAAEVIAVTKIDHHVIGGGKVGPIAQRLTKAFRDFINSGEELDLE